MNYYQLIKNLQIWGSTPSGAPFLAYVNQNCAVEQERQLRG